jgi:hypothetical protein
LEKIKEFLSGWASGPKQVALDHAVVFKNEGGFGFDIGVVGGQIIGKKFTIFKNGINGLAKVSGITAKVPHGHAVGGMVFAYVKFGSKRH